MLKQESIHFVLALCIRLFFTFYGVYHDSMVTRVDFSQNTTNIGPKFTDVDYQVFSDAALYVHQVIKRPKY